MEYTILILLLPLASFLVLGLAGMKMRPAAAGAVGTAVLAVVALLSYWTAFEYFSAGRDVAGVFPTLIPWNAVWLPIGGALHIDLGILLDPISVMMLVVISTVSLMVHIYSLGYMKGERGFQRYYAFLSLFTMSMIGLVVATNIFQMYLFWELVGVSSYLLIGFYYTKKEAVAASKKAFIVTRFADLGFLIGILIYGYYAGTFSFTPETHALVAAGAMIPLALGLMFVGGAGKSAMFPLHIWLPDAMEGPTPVSALIHAATMVVALCAPQAHASKDVVLAIASTLTTTDPWDANDTLSHACAKTFYEGLFGFNEKLELRPVLAESYDVSPDGLVYTFHLRKGVKFHDGTDFNAEAVKVNFDRVTNPENKLKRYSLYSNIAKTEVVDDLTAKVTLKTPFSPFINQLAHPSAVMISPTALKKYGKDIMFHPVGTGPYKFVEWKQTDYLKGAKNENYWRPGLPKIDTITWVPVVDNNARSAMMRTGEAHFTFPVPYEQAAVLEKDEHLKLVAAPSIVTRYLNMNMLQKPFDDLRVRQAINYAINKEALAKVAFSGYAFPSEGPLPQGVDYAVKLGPWPYNPKKAKELLAEAGYPNGFETTLWSAYNHTTGQKVIQFIQQQLAQVGIKAQVQALEAGQRVEKVESHQDAATAPVRLYYTGWSSSTGEADWGLRPLFAGDKTPPSMYNISYYKNPTVDADIMKALGTTDRAEKTKLYTEVQEEIWKDAPWAFLVTEKLLYATSKKLTGMYVMPDANYFFEEIDLQ